MLRKTMAALAVGMALCGPVGCATVPPGGGVAVAPRDVNRAFWAMEAGVNAANNAALAAARSGALIPGSRAAVRVADALADMDQKRKVAEVAFRAANTSPSDRAALITQATAAALAVVSLIPEKTQ